MVSVESSNKGLIYPNNIWTFSFESKRSLFDKDSMILKAKDVHEEKFKKTMISGKYKKSNIDNSLSKGATNKLRKIFSPS